MFLRTVYNILFDKLMESKTIRNKTHWTFSVYFLIDDQEIRTIHEYARQVILITNKGWGKLNKYNSVI